MKLHVYRTQYLIKNSREQSESIVNDGFIALAIAHSPYPHPPNRPHTQTHSN